MSSKKTFDDQLLPLKELSKYSGLSIRTLRYMLKKSRVGPLPHLRTDGKILVRRSEFDLFIEGFRVSPENTKSIGKDSGHTSPYSNN